MSADNLTLDEVMTRRFQLVADQAIIAARHKVELTPLVDELNLCETFIKSEMLASGSQSWKSASTGDMAFFTLKDSVTVKDMPAVIEYMVRAAPKPADLTDTQWEAAVINVIGGGMWELLNKAVNKTAAKELIEAQKAPPGVEYSSYRDLAWRKGKEPA